MTLIIGGSGSGKSAYAEEYITALCKEDFLRRELSLRERTYYLATMLAYDDEDRKRIARHRQQRSGKGFSTIEQPTAVERAAEKMKPGEKAALLECISNLTANEMFAGTAPKREEAVTEKIVRGIAALKKELTHFVVVSNNVFEDGRVYDEATMAYIRALGRINEYLADMADEVVEVVVGIPIFIKEKQKGP